MSSTGGMGVVGCALGRARFTIARQEYGERVPRPAWWGGYRIVPEEFEFWQGRPSRLHDRLRYVKEASGVWRRERLAP